MAAGSWLEGAMKQTFKNHAAAESRMTAELMKRASPQRARASRVPLAVVSFPSADLQVRVARDPTDLVAGLSGIRTLPDNTGMLFVLPAEGPAYFWMRDTHIPLDIALLDANMRVRSIHTMEPETGEARDSGPIKYAVETNAGWFAQNGVEVGDVGEYGGRNG